MKLGIGSEVRLTKISNSQDTEIPTGWDKTVILTSDVEMQRPISFKSEKGIGSTSSIEHISPDTHNPESLIIQTRTSVYRLTSKEAFKVKSFEEIANDTETPADTALALQENLFRPIEKVSIEGQVFCLSPVLTGLSRDIVIVYASSGSLTRIFYRSDSDGGWRLNVPNTNPKTQELCKGLNLKNLTQYRHYTRETKPHELLTNAIERLPTVKVSVSSHYDKYQKLLEANRSQQNFDQYCQEVVYQGAFKSLKDVYKPFKDIGFYTGVIYEPKETKITTETLQSIQYPEGFIPNFSKPAQRAYTTSHSIFSERKTGGGFKNDIKVEVYESVLGEHGELEWHICSDPAGRVWVDKIDVKGNPINSFGTKRNIYDFGVFDLKPVEYRSQAKPIPDSQKILIDGSSFFNPYLDITPFLSGLEPIKRYKESKKLAG